MWSVSRGLGANWVNVYQIVKKKRWYAEINALIPKPRMIIAVNAAVNAKKATFARMGSASSIVKKVKRSVVIYV
jgi:hypothetical protein